MSTTDPDEFDFDTEDLRPQERQVRYRAKSYVLLEASESAAVEYRNACARSARMTDGKVTGVDRVGDVQPLLVSLCLAETENGALKVDRLGNPVLVPLSLVKSWQARVVRPLFEWVVAHSELSENETEEILLKRLADTQKKLDVLRREKATAANGEGSSPNEGHVSTSATSD